MGHFYPYSYIYDNDTGLYYLQSRYYDPKIGRFINADNYPSTGQGLIGNNMFAYCLNNPVKLADLQGSSATIAGGIGGGLFGFIGALSSEIADDKNGGPDGVRWDKVWLCTLSSVGTGAAVGFVADASIATFGAAPAMLITAGGGAFFSGANSLITQQTLTGDIDGAKMFSDAVLGGITNGLGAGTSSILSPIVDDLSAGIKFAGTQLTTEIMYGFANFGSFVMDDLLPTIATSFGSWYGGLAYDYLNR